MKKYKTNIYNMLLFVEDWKNKYTFHISLVKHKETELTKWFSVTEKGGTTP
jgi:hypothetical protein